MVSQNITEEPKVAQVVGRRASMVASLHISSEQPKTKGHGRRAKVTIAVIALSNLCAWSCISLIAPFFPIEAEQKGTSVTLIGMIYSLPELVIFLMSPVVGKLLTYQSPRFFYIAGLCVFGSCDVMFGFLDKSPSGSTFIGLCFAVRIVEAVGTAMIMTASYAIAGMNFPDRISTVYGILTTVTSCGFLIGPSIGGALYQLGGFGLPFWALGGCVFICGCASCIVLPSQGCIEEGSGPSSLALLRSPRVLYGSVSLAFGILGFTLYEPIFAQHLQQFGLSQSIIGFIFIVPSVTYSSTSPLWGWALDKWVPAIPLKIAGLVCTAICFLFFGPAPFFTFLSPNLTLTIVMLAFIGLCLAPVAVAAMRLVVDGARELGFKDDMATFGLVGGIVQSSTCLGTFAGPMLGGVFADKYGFPWTMVVTSLLLIVPIVLFSPYLVILCRRHYLQSSTPSLKHYGKIPGDDVTNVNVSTTYH